MNYDIQRASMLKRVPAWLLDIILLITVATGFLTLWSQVFDVMPHVEKLSGIVEKYEAEYGGQLSMSVEEYEKLTAEEKMPQRTFSPW